VFNSQDKVGGNFEIGQKVKKTSKGGRFEPRKGAVGIVRSIEGACYGIEWEGFKNGHRLSGELAQSNGYFVHGDNLKLYGPTVKTFTAKSGKLSDSFTTTKGQAWLIMGEYRMAFNALDKRNIEITIWTPGKTGSPVDWAEVKVSNQRVKVVTQKSLGTGVPETTGVTYTPEQDPKDACPHCGVLGERFEDKSEGFEPRMYCQACGHGDPIRKDPDVRGFHGEELRFGDRVTVTGEAVEHSLRYLTGDIVGFRRDMGDQDVAGWPLVYFPQVDGLHDGRGMADRELDGELLGRHLWFVHPANLVMVSRKKS
jgi:hypothetical protein